MMREGNWGLEPPRSIPTCANLAIFNIMMNSVDRVTSDSGADFVKMMVANPDFLEKTTLSDQEVAIVLKTLSHKGASQRATWEASAKNGHYETLLALDVPKDISESEIVSWFMSGLDCRATRTLSSLDEDKIKEVLVKLSGCNPDISRISRVGEREHPLYIAMEHGWFGVTKQLLDMGFDPKAPPSSTYSDLTVIGMACARGYTKMVNLMVNHKVLVAEVGSTDDTLICQCCESQRVTALLLGIALVSVTLGRNLP